MGITAFEQLKITEIMESKLEEEEAAILGVYEDDDISDVDMVWEGENGFEGTGDASMLFSKSSKNSKMSAEIRTKTASLSFNIDPEGYGDD